ETVGYQVRFTKQTGESTRVKVMTDGILLAEIGQDRDLKRYDTIIIDEAHERSLNIDFLLGYLKQLLRRRPELRVVITSATIDTLAFSKHFSDAPIVEVEGRTYPVEIRYEPPEEGADPVEEVCRAVAELYRDTSGDILVFFPGERQIRDASDAIKALGLPIEVLELYARLPAAKQHEVFHHHAKRRVVLATNIAETSVTVPGVRAVVDTGFARISRYSPRSKVQRLPIEPVAQASCDQRAGRCGRVGPGICVRLYSEEDYNSRPEFSEPEILRTSLASVILQMAWARLGDIESFEFIDKPDTRQISDGLRLLRELGAISDGKTGGPRSGGGKPGERDSSGARANQDHTAKKPQNSGVRLTGIGRKLARLPIDVRLARMLVEAERQGCLREVQAIVAGLSIVDVRERPQEAEDKADESHRRFNFNDRGEYDPSDVMALLRLWRYLRDKRKALSSSAFRRLCRDEYFNYLRVREWQDLRTQLKSLCDELHLRRNDSPGTDYAIHTAILSGLLSQVGALDERTKDKPQRGQGKRRGPREYIGAHGTRFVISRSSASSRAVPALVAAVELVETARLYAHTVFPISAEQVEEVGARLVKRSYSEPRWFESSGSAMAEEHVTLYGVPIVAGKLVGYGLVNQAEARELFIVNALVEGKWQPRWRFWKHNQRVLEKASELEDQARRSLVSDIALHDFYAARLPENIVSTAHFDSWWKRAERKTPHLLDLELDEVVDDFEAEESMYPRVWTVGGEDFGLDYAFDPQSSRDGVTVEIPLAKLNRVDPQSFTWQIPALREQLATELIRKLPKEYRAKLAPAPDSAREALDWVGAHGDPATSLRYAQDDGGSGTGQDDGGSGAGQDGGGSGAGQDGGGSGADQDGGGSGTGQTGAGSGLGQNGAEKTRHSARSRGISSENSDVPFTQALGEGILHTKGILIPAEAWNESAIPDFLKIHYRVVDGQREYSGDSLEELRGRLGAQVQKSLNRQAKALTHPGATTWEFGEIQRNTPQGGFLALADEVTKVSVKVFETEVEARRSHARGLRRLLTLVNPDPTRWAVSHMSNPDKFVLPASPYKEVKELLADAKLATNGMLAARRADPWEVRDGKAFKHLADSVRQDAADLMLRIVNEAAAIVREESKARDLLAKVPPSTKEDVDAQLEGLLFPGFISATPERWYFRLRVYMRAIVRRCEQAMESPTRDLKRTDEILELEDEYAASIKDVQVLTDAQLETGWLLEEFRVSLFAQQLGTIQPVSAKRIRARL
ncbi:MAG: DUF3418 domain-containing protein, partial [Propionibacteriaceae bacterium]|nr:DUF3418 domain-containing protein [Propionibacteriaceae bacterium]